MDSTLQLCFLDQPFKLDLEGDVHEIVIEGWMMDQELSIAWEYYTHQLCALLSHYEQISAACIDHLQAHETSE